MFRLKTASLSIQNRTTYQSKVVRFFYINGMKYCNTSINEDRVLSKQIVHQYHVVYLAGVQEALVKHCSVGNFNSFGAHLGWKVRQIDEFLIVLAHVEG